MSSWGEFECAHDTGGRKKEKGKSKSRRREQKAGGRRQEAAGLQFGIGNWEPGAGQRVDRDSKFLSRESRHATCYKGSEQI